MGKYSYELEQEKIYVKRILKLFYNDVPSFTKEITTDVQFLERYRIKEFFLKIINGFNSELHLPHAKKLFFNYLEEWNKNNPDKIIDQSELVNKFYFLHSKYFGIINPYLLRTPTKANNILEFFKSINNNHLYYPFFYGNHIIESFNDMGYEASFTLQNLLGDDEDLYDAIFHNYKGMKGLFNEALTEYLMAISYSDWEINIDKYFALVMSLSYMELNPSHVIDSIGVFKKDKLKNHAISILKQNNEILFFENSNNLRRLQYAPHQIEGIDISNPPVGSSLVPFVEDETHDNNIFNHIKSILGRIDNSYEISNLFHDLFKDVEFILWIFGKEFTSTEWQDILDSCDSIYYRYEFLNIISQKKDTLVELNTLSFFPYIILNLLNSSTNNNLFKDSSLDIIQINSRVLKYIVDSVVEIKEAELNVIIDLYLSLPQSPSLVSYDYQYQTKKNLRDHIIGIFSKNKSRTLFDILFSKVNEQLKSHNNFSIFDIFIDYWEYSIDLKTIIVDHYFKLLDEQIFSYHYYDLNGKENLFKAISFLNQSELKDFLNKYDFISYFDKATEETTDLYYYGSKLRFHLGVLTEYSINHTENKSDIPDHVLNCYKHIIKNKSVDVNPLLWDKIVSDTFLFNTNFNESQLLSIIIIDLLKNKEANFVTEFFNEIKEYLAFTELVFYQKAFKDNSEIKNFNLNLAFPDDLKNTGLGLAEREAHLLLKFDFPEKAVKYVEYIESLGKKYLSNEMVEIKFRSFLLLKEYEKAEDTLNAIMTNKDNLLGLLYYFKDDFRSSVECFERYKRNVPHMGKYDIINFSAALIQNNQHPDAIKLLEESRDKFQNEYLFFLNLGIAYKNIDRIKSLNNFLTAKEIAVDVTDAKFILYESLIALIPEFAKINNEFSDHPSASSELINKFYMNSIETIRKTFPYKINDTEKLIVKEIFYAIEQKRLGSYRLGNYSENEMSDELKYVIQSSLKHKNIIVEREAPAGYSLIKSGEIDFYLYSSDTTILFAVGENKEWSKSKYEKQLKQLLGYAKANRGFCFTIIFNKSEKLSTILEQRENILTNFKLVEDGQIYFEITDKIYDVSFLIDGIKDVILTFHKNPEDGSTLRIYHFIIDANEQERKVAAIQARPKHK